MIDPSNKLGTDTLRKAKEYEAIKPEMEIVMRKAALLDEAVEIIESLIDCVPTWSLAKADGYDFIAAIRKMDKKP